LEDSRMSISLAVVAATLLVSLLLVMIFRHFIARQLNEIDQMADAQELEDVRADLPEAT
jgi:flagellar biosynthesis/type III secretory pathway M-ring protein FliF/YscJ